MTLSSTRKLEDLLPTLRFPDGPLSLVNRWREVAAALPDVPAVVDADGGSYTFGEADRLSDLIALELVRVLGDDEAPVAALLGHDAHAIVALLALLKTGRIRVVLDTHLPAERLRQIAHIAEVRLILVDDRFDELGGALDLPARLSLDTLLTAARSSTATPAELEARVATELAFGEARRGVDPFEIVFTSGSTGAPKGVLQRHGTFLNEVVSWKSVRRFEAGDRVAVPLPLSFAGGSGNLTTTLLGGSTAYLIDPRETGIPALLDFLRANRIIGTVFTPHLARGLVSGLGDGEILPDLRFLGTLGEAMHGRDAKAILEHLGPDATYVNEFGTSEINCLSTYAIRQGDVIPDGNLPAGRVFDRKTVRLVDENGDEVPAGQTGELTVVSDFLSGGYWKNDELNAAKFGIDDDGHEFVRQGDLARMSSDGVLQLLGRADAGLKIRGYLVEPGEIEGALVSLDEVAEAAVVPLVSADGTTRLAAYVVPRPGVRPPSNAAIRRSLRAVLPEYMVPSEIVLLADFPRTERGKVDRKGLPEIPEHVVDVYEMNQRELAMSTIWQQVLELPAIGPDDDFMALGGDSLSAEELLTLVTEHFAVDVPSTDILAFPTLREFTAHVTSGAPTEATSADHVVFNRDATGTPYFAFAGAGALALTYLPLSRHLAQHPVYAFQQHGLERRARPDRTVQATVTRHLATIRAARPHGPYRLIGHSFGGLIALETARRLTEAGEVVEALVILDTHLPRYVADQPDAARELVRRRSLRERLLPDGLPDRAHLGRQIRARFAGIWRHAGQLQYDAFYDLAGLMMRRYVLTPYAGRALLVIADENPHGDAWPDVLTGDRSDIAMRAEHTSLLREPHVATLADELRPHLPLD